MQEPLQLVRHLVEAENDLSGVDLCMHIHVQLDSSSNQNTVYYVGCVPVLDNWKSDQRPFTKHANLFAPLPCQNANESASKGASLYNAGLPGDGDIEYPVLGIKMAEQRKQVITILNAIRNLS